MPSSLSLLPLASFTDALCRLAEAEPSSERLVELDGESSLELGEACDESSSKLQEGVADGMPLKEVDRVSKAAFAALAALRQACSTETDSMRVGSPVALLLITPLGLGESCPVTTFSVRAAWLLLLFYCMFLTAKQDHAVRAQAVMTQQPDLHLRHPGCWAPQGSEAPMLLQHVH